jgi:hypothetical protein
MGEKLTAQIEDDPFTYAGGEPPLHHPDQSIDSGNEDHPEPEQGQLSDVLVGNRLVNENPDQNRRYNRKPGDDEDGRNDADEPRLVRPPVAPDPLQQSAIDVGLVLLLVVLEIAPPTTAVKDVVPPGSVRRLSGIGLY